MEQLQGEIDNRLKQLTKTVKLHGFRTGKVPLAMIQKMYGGQVRQDVLNDAVHKGFKDTVKEQNLQVVGYPRFEAKVDGTDNTQYTVSATFEVYPEIVLGDLSKQSIERPEVRIEEDDIEKTLKIICKQRVTYKKIQRSARNGDRIEIDFRGTVDGKEFSGGSAEGVQLILGDGKYLKDFEAPIVDMEIGQRKTVDVVFPEDYHGKDLSGKTAAFEITLKDLEEPIFPVIDAAFAQSMGIPDGDVKKLREGVHKDIEHEASRRIRVKLKEQLMRALVNVTQFDAPVVLVNQEKERLLQSAKSEFESRGIKSDKLPFTAGSFEEKAEYRVKLGLIISELINVHQLKPTPAQIRSVIEDAAQSYENPDQVVKWHYASEDRLKEAEALALEENVANWALSKVNITDKTITFDELMGRV
ncbi:MAG: trigger factor [Nitrosomonas sp.]|nr:MAG: trigger factor [Nitrosomonas sp.]